MAGPNASDSSGAAGMYGPYKVGTLIGAGAMASIYEAVDTRSGARVALKVLGEALSEHSEIVSRFIREGRALENLTNPNIVRVFEHGITPHGEPWLAMERLAGGTLESLVRFEGTLEPSRAVRLARDVANALATVHAHGIIHRDVKPGNVFVVEPDSPRETAKLIDFGIARVSEQEMGMHSIPYTRVDRMLGTAAFVAPEQAIGKEVDARADVFSLAVTLYEMLTGKLPYEGDSIQAQLKARLEGRLVPILRRAKDVPRPLADLLDRALSTDPARRPADGAAMLRELEAVRASLGAASARSVPVASADARAVRPPAFSLPETPDYAVAVSSPATSTPRRILVVVGVVLAIVALGAGTFALLRALDVFGP